MKTGVMAILVFVAAFVITTAALIFMNTQYRNIFSFDFTPVALPGVPADSTGVVKTDSTAVKNDSTKALDSLSAIANSLAPKQDSTALSSNSQNDKKDPAAAQNQKTAADQKNKTLTQGNLQISPEMGKIKSDIISADIKKMDAAAYEKWKKNTAGIIESMDSYKASQILRMYADNIGNELLYAMKKKKAAEILSKFDAKKDSLIIRKLTRIQ